MSWAARDWATEVWTSTRDWSRDGRDRLVGKPTDVKLSPGAKLVLFALADRASRDTHECWPAKERLAHDTGLGVSGVKTALKQLVAAGFVEREPRNRDGRRTSDLYKLQIPPAWLAEWERSRGSESDQTQVESNPEPTKEPTTTSSNYPPSTCKEGLGSESNPLDSEGRCLGCGAFLARDNDGPYCSPCEAALLPPSQRIAVVA